MKNYIRAIELNTKFVDAYFFMADVKWELKDWRGVIEDDSKVIALNPKHAGAYYYRGFAKIKIGQKESGCLDLSKSGELGKTLAYAVIKDNYN